VHLGYQAPDFGNSQVFRKGNDVAKLGVQISIFADNPDKSDQAIR